MSKLLEWDECCCQIVDIFFDTYKGDDGWGFSVTHIYGSGGAFVTEREGCKSERGAKLAADHWFKTIGRSALINRFLGWFDNPHEAPVHEPEWHYCPFCTDSYRLGGNEPLVTVSLMIPGDFRSYFYRAHKACYDKDAKRVSRLEDDFMEMVRRQGLIDETDEYWEVGGDTNQITGYDPTWNH